MKRALGIALAGALAWGLAALLNLAVGADGPLVVTALVSALALGGLVAVVVGLGIVAVGLIRSR